jgi:hypothetical protein
MRNSKFGLRAFGLALMAALGLMAFTAVAAQAEEPVGTPGSFLVKGEKTLAKLGVTFSATQLGTGTLLVPGRVDILCTSGTATGEFHNESDVLVEATFSGCTPWQPVTVLGASHVTKVACTVAQPIVAKALGKPRLHNGGKYVLLEGTAGANQLFASVLLEGPECPLTKHNEVKGSVVAQIDNSDTTEPTLLFSHTIQKLFQIGTTEGDRLKFGTLEAYVDGEAKGKLTDAAHVGLTFGVC